jgi:hypothetical protein
MTSCRSTVVEGVAYKETTLECSVMDIVVQYFDGCPNWEQARDRLDTVIDKEMATIRFETIGTVEKAESAGFRGSLTILLDGVDPFADVDAPVGLRVVCTPPIRATKVHLQWCNAKQRLVQQRRRSPLGSQHRPI